MAKGLDAACAQIRQHRRQRHERGAHLLRRDGLQRRIAAVVSHRLDRQSVAQAKELDRNMRDAHLARASDEQTIPRRFALRVSNPAGSHASIRCLQSIRTACSRRAQPVAALYQRVILSLLPEPRSRAAERATICRGRRYEDGGVVTALPGFARHDGRRIGFTLQRLRNVYRKNVRERRRRVTLHRPQHFVGRNRAGDLDGTCRRKGMNELDGPGRASRGGGLATRKQECCNQEITHRIPLSGMTRT